MNRIDRGLFLAVSAVVLLAGCSNEHDLGPTVNPLDPRDGGTVPPVPANVEVDVGNRELVVAWELSDSSLADQVRSYRIWRRVPPALEAQLADSSASSPVRIAGIANGQSNLISVSAVLHNGLEGRRSAETGGTPGLFAVVIEEGRSVTNARRVGLNLTAPEGTGAVLVGSDAELTAAVTRPFEPLLYWTLSLGDGEKEVFVRFIDADGNHSETTSDRIELDTIAEILDFDFDGSETRAPGDQIIFTMNTGEGGGTAEVELGRGGEIRTLRDDGVDPDAAAADGIYTLRYEAETAVQFIGAEITGHFTDEAGNAAPERTASRPLTVHEAPPALVLEEPTSPSPEEITLEWSRVPEGIPFGSYRLYRGESPGVDTLETRRLVREITSAAETSLTDTDVVPDRLYYYRVELVDPFGTATPSNEVSATTRANDPPDPIVLGPPYAVTERSVSLSWERTFAEDFEAYRLLRGEQPGVQQDPQRRTLAELNDPAQNTFEDVDEIEEGSTYYYVVEVVDRFGASSASNEVSATLDDLFPSSVSLSAPDAPGETTIGLSWTRNDDLDFASYQLYRSESPGVDEAAQRVATLQEAERTRWIDEGLQENTAFYYRVYVYDKGGHASPSDELMVTTANADPPAATLSTPVEVGGAGTPTVDLSWSASTIHDFAAYRLYRDTAPAVGEEATLVRTVDTASTTTFRDAGLSDNTRYYYRVFVQDDAGGSTGSNETSIVTTNRPPTPVTLSLSGTTTTSISLTWTQSTDVDYQQHRLLRGPSPGAINTTVATFTQPEQTTYTDFLPGQDPAQDLFYKVVVYDEEIDGTGSLSSDSNIISARVSTE